MRLIGFIIFFLNLFSPTFNYAEDDNIVLYSDIFTGIWEDEYGRCNGYSLVRYSWGLGLQIPNRSVIIDLNKNDPFIVVPLMTFKVIKIIQESENIYRFILDDNFGKIKGHEVKVEILGRNLLKFYPDKSPYDERYKFAFPPGPGDGTFYKEYGPGTKIIKDFFSLLKEQ